MALDIYAEYIAESAPSRVRRARLCELLEYPYLHAHRYLHARETRHSGETYPLVEHMFGLFWVKADSVFERATTVSLHLPAQV